MYQMNMPTESPPTFTVITVLRESVENTLRFVHWYKQLGAAEIIMFFDNPDDDAIPHLSGIAGLRAIRCDEDFWQSIGQFSDKKFVKRQNAALNLGYREATSDWALVVDSDEFLYDTRRDFTHRLAGLDNTVRAVRIAPAEILQTDPLSEVRNFRVPMSKAQINTVYGDHAWMFRRRNGLVGHYQGKSIIRTGQKDIRLRQHWAEDRDREKVADAFWQHEDEIYILHYFGGAYDEWRAKLEWRNVAWGFARNINTLFDDLRAKKDEEEIAKRYAVLHEANAERLEKMRTGNVLLEIEKETIPAP